MFLIYDTCTIVIRTFCSIMTFHGPNESWKSDRDVIDCIVNS